MYEVFVDDNYSFMEESGRYSLGRYSSLDAAIEVSRKIVDENLASACRPGMSAEALLIAYKSYGEDPFIVSTDPEDTVVLFSAWEYAKTRSAELCASAQD